MDIRALMARLTRAFPGNGRKNRHGEEPSAKDAYRLLAENCLDVVFRLDDRGRFRYISPSAERLFGCPPEELLRREGDATANPFLCPDDQPMVAKAIHDHLSGAVAETRLEFRILQVDGTPVWVETNGRAVADPETGRITDIVFTMRDTSEKKALELLLSQQARIDALTGLHNRRAFDEALGEALRRSRRSASPVSLILTDVDHFKPYNDTLGHCAGDDCLARIGALLNAAVHRAGDMAARYGGEEFALILPDCPLDAAMDRAEALRCGVMAAALPHPSSPTSDHITISLGVAEFPANGGDPAALVAAADAALYEAKKAGRNRACAAPPASPGQQLRSA